MDEVEPMPIQASGQRVRPDVLDRIPPHVRHAQAFTLGKALQARRDQAQELRIVLREWHRRIPEYELAPGTELRWPPGLRHVENVHLAW